MFVLLFLGVARASSIYPGVVESELSMPCAPQCTLCHTNNAGGGGTVTRDFGLAMMDRGLEGGSQRDLLKAALSQMETDAVDSNADGVTDIDALIAGEDPNGGPAFCGDTALPTPVYGCFNHTPGMAGFGVSAAIALAIRRRRSSVLLVPLIETPGRSRLEDREAEGRDDRST
jgi:hypothetical protein